MNLQGIKKRIVKILVYTATSIIFLLISSFLVLQLPAVQRALAKQYLSGFSEIVGFKTTITSIRFSWFDRLVLEGIVIEDPEHNEMIAVKELQVNYKISTLMQGNDINIDAVFLDTARVFFTKIADSDTSTDLNINVFIDQVNKQYGGSGKGGKPKKLNIGEAILQNSNFAYDNTGRDSLRGFDYNHFQLDIPEAQLQNFGVIGDTIQFDVNSLAATDQKTKFRITQLNTFFRISQDAMEFRGLEVKAGQSTIRDTIIFTYNRQLDLNDFVNKVNIEAHFQNTIIHPKDLALFAPAASRLRLPIILSGDYKGRVNNFNCTDLDLKTGNTILQGSISMDGLPDINETFIVLYLKNSRVDFDDISFLFNDQALSRLIPLGRLSVNGQFLGYPSDFVANGDFSNNLGRIVSDINLKINENSLENSSYGGQLSMINFDLGRYLNDTINYQKVNLSGKIKGSGLTQRTANFELVSIIKSIGIRGYNYRNIETDAQFSSQFFKGDLKVQDPNMRVTAKGSVDLRNGLNLINIQANLDTINLDELHLSKKKFSLHGLVDVNMKGFELDSLSGNAVANNLVLNYDGQQLKLDNASLDATKNKRERSLIFESDLARAKIDGDFYFSHLFRDIKVLTHEFFLNVQNDKDKIKEYYATKTRIPEDYEARFDIDLKNIKPVTNLINLNLKVGRNTKVNGKFVSGNTTLIHAFTHIDSVQYEDMLMADTEIEINASKIADSTQALAMVYVTSGMQEMGAIKTEKFITEAIWNNDHIDFSISLDQKQKDNRLRLQGLVDFNDSTEIKLLDDSRIEMLQKVWTIDASNKLSVKGKEWGVHNIKWQNETQSVNLDGHISEDKTKDLRLIIRNFNLATLNSISQRELSGQLNAEITSHNLYSEPTLQNEIDIQELKVDDFLIGDITGNNLWDPIEKKFMLEFFIDRLDNRIINCAGSFNPSDKISPLDVTAKLQKANLKILEPFIDQILSNLEGTVSGTYAITGTLNKPLLNGTGEIEGGQLMVNYLKTTYKVTGTVGLKPKAIYFENIEITDTFRNKGKLRGAITHDNFRQMAIDLQATYDNLHLLNTSARDNSLFYGQGFATGDVRLSGPISNLIITANATTKKNSRVYIPMASSSSTEKKEFINFVNMTDSTYKSTVAEVTKKVNLTGITFDLNLDVTPDAYCEIIFDIKSGDIIRGRGNGRIKLQLDTKGEFNMFGPVVFTEGGYNFTLYDIINKEFDISPGSSISWYGDPYQGQMKINATYNQLASYAPILNDPTLNTTPQIRRKYPAQVLLKLEGPMLSPSIDFDIIAKDLPKSITTEDGRTVRLESEFEAFKNKLDEQELKRQVFSLIVLRKFSPPESFNTSGSIVNSVSELFSNQLSYWMNQVDENLEIDVDLGSMDQESFNAFQLRLSYTFLNGRLRVTRDGTFGNQGGNQSNNSSTSANNGSNLSSIGDWTIDYLLTPDGKFKVKMYSRTNVNPVTNLNQQNAITTGVSLLYTQSFNEFRDLLKSSRNKNRSKKKPESPAEPNQAAIKEDETNE